MYCQTLYVQNIHINYNLWNAVKFAILATLAFHFLPRIALRKKLYTLNKSSIENSYNENIAVFRDKLRLVIGITVF